MKCPKCGQEMIDGNILGDRFSLKFFPNNSKKIDNDVLKKGTIKKFIELTEKPFLRRGKLDCYYCSACKIIIAPVKDIDN